MIKKSEIISIDILDLTPEQLARIIRRNRLSITLLQILCNGGKHNLLHVLDYLQQEELSFGRVYSELPTLNDVFLEITGKQLRD